MKSKFLSASVFLYDALAPFFKDFLNMIAHFVFICLIAAATLPLVGGELSTMIAVCAVVWAWAKLREVQKAADGYNRNIAKMQEIVDTLEKRVEKYQKPNKCIIKKKDAWGHSEPCYIVEVEPEQYVVEKEKVEK